MASSNRHWPSMFKSKPCNSPLQWNHDISPSLCHRSAPYPPERSPDPKPRWNPRPEQIRILEAIFNSGMVNPPREEIRRIRTQLQQYGQVGDANVFYWFQNRKSRTKNKSRHHDAPAKKQHKLSSASSSSSSDGSSFSGFPLHHPTNMAPSGASLPAATSLLHTPHGQFFPEPAFIADPLGLGPEYGFSPDLMDFVCHAPDQTVVGNYLVNDVREEEDDGVLQKAKDEMTMTEPCTRTLFLSHPPGFTVHDPATINLSHHHGTGEEARSTVFINEVAYDVAAAPFNVREAFGADALLLQSSGQAVDTDEWGVTVMPLQNGAFYYMVRTIPHFGERSFSAEDVVSC